MIGTEIIELINSGLDNDTNKPKTIQEYLEVWKEYILL